MEDVLDIITYLLDHLDDEDDESLERHLRAVGFPDDDIQRALDWMAGFAGDDQDRRHRHHRDENGQHRVLPESEERLLRTVARGGDPVRAQPHPCEEGDEGDVVEDLRVEQIPGSAEQDPFRTPVQGVVFHRCLHLSGKGIRGRPRRQVYIRLPPILPETGLRRRRTSARSPSAGAAAALFRGGDRRSPGVRRKGRCP
ncbi:MAG: hypothetical protein B7Z74_03035 [Deltaproteobacteria bacterium 21-66-5]|nr:MAG: hypothetical protein B7Z74_03035 [Deltaproteobacteria bacterium 21-66-5]